MGHSNPWRERLHRRLEGQARPLLVFPDRTLPAASLWGSARTWVDALRTAGLVDGDRVILAADAGPAFVPMLVAGLWLRLTLAVVAKLPAESTDLLSRFDARLLVASAGARCVHAPAFDAAGLPLGPLEPRRTIGTRTPQARLLLATSGTSSAGRWIALSDRNLLAVLDSHVVLYPVEAACLLSILPWHHAFGLVLDLLAGLMSGADIIRNEAAGRDPALLLAAGRDHPVTHLNAVPITVEHLHRQAGGSDFLRGLQGGLIGGAPISAKVAGILGHSRLRVGYGQTEAAPGICLGAQGEFSAGWIGRPVGCAVRVEPDGTLAFSGPNAALGEWTAHGLVVLDSDRWVRTGDLVCQKGDGYVFEGRLTDAFKMANGRFISAAVVEQAVLAACPGVELCMVGTLDGERMEIAVTASDFASIPQDALASQLSGLGVREFRLLPVPQEGWSRGPKGELDRRNPPWKG